MVELIQRLLLLEPLLLPLLFAPVRAEPELLLLVVERLPLALVLLPLLPLLLPVFFVGITHTPHIPAPAP